MSKAQKLDDTPREQSRPKTETEFVKEFHQGLNEPVPKKIFDAWAISLGNNPRRMWDLYCNTFLPSERKVISASKEKSRKRRRSILHNEIENCVKRQHTLNQNVIQEEYCHFATLAHDDETSEQDETEKMEFRDVMICQVPGVPSVATNRDKIPPVLFKKHFAFPFDWNLWADMEVIIFADIENIPLIINGPVPDKWAIMCAYGENFPQVPITDDMLPLLLKNHIAFMCRQWQGTSRFSVGFACNGCTSIS